MPALTRSKQDYLKALWSLAPVGGPVPTSRLAAHLGVSAPSVTNMLGRLAAEDLVAHAPRAGARLTARGRRAALGMVRRHRILETFLVEVLGLDWAEVHDDAEVLEHHVSDRVLEALDRVMGHPAEDPHGSPIPDADMDCVRRAIDAGKGPASDQIKDPVIAEEEAAPLALHQAFELVIGQILAAEQELDEVVGLYVVAPE